MEGAGSVGGTGDWRDMLRSDSMFVGRDGRRGMAEGAEPAEGRVREVHDAQRMEAEGWVANPWRLPPGTQASADHDSPARRIPHPSRDGP
jgi:hypothetical protein